ncbi:MAG: UDP-3-O-(3-hydroxymyristoyl)glucosamine N-acyltransferase [Rhodospirillales bacterium]|nr:MAG: UDP-3-O-(3-hydroxymyristoyl)glucosamine N-acyltransferase [Rhodospirillales bacterium]
MADPRFYPVNGPFSLAQLAEAVGAEIGADADPDRLFGGVAALDQAGPGEVSFLEDRRLLPAFRNTRAGACVVRPDMAGEAPAGTALLLSTEPHRAFAKLAAAFHPMPEWEAGVHPTAILETGARIGDGTRIEAYAVVGADAEIGAGCCIGPHVVVGRGCVIGSGVMVGAGASLLFCRIGNRVIIHPGVRIGQDGYGYVLGSAGHLKVPQLGGVVIDDDVEIGANTTVDRGALGDTVIGAGTKIDNLVQIGHNVRIGRGCMVVSQVGISGSTTIGDFVMIAGQAGLSGHLKVGDGARIGAQSGIMRDIPPGQTVFGYPAMPYKQYMRQVALLARLAQKKGS